jgi:hypothetical protein
LTPSPANNSKTGQLVARKLGGPQDLNRCVVLD